jgi:acyl carrier protein
MRIVQSRRGGALQNGNRDIDRRVRDVIARTFRIGDPDAAEMRMGSVQGWDSLGHMRLVVELEQEFGVSFPTYLLSELLDADRIAKEIRNLQ